MELTTTSYAILGLLGTRSWTTYELAQQMERSLRNFWPRAQSRVYEEPKRLAALGLATATRDHVGRRPRTTYTITAKGRRALRRWLADTENSGRPVLEFESLLKVFFGDQGRTVDVAANIEAMARWAAEQNAENVAFARLYRDTGGPFPDRLPVIALTGRFLTDLADMVAAWAAWAADTVASWPDDVSEAAPDMSVFERVAARTP